MPSASPSSTTSSPLRVLVSGAGVAGPILAYWLSKGGAHVTVVERASSLRREGQTVDVRGEGIEILRRMGVEQLVRSKTTHEKGLAFVDANGRCWGAFPEDGDASFTSDIEIVRGELAMTLYEATRSLPGVKYVFGESIRSLTNGADSVDVTFGSSKPDDAAQSYDVLIVSEGLGSRTRALAFGEDVRTSIYALNVFTAGFSVPARGEDSDWAQLHSLTGRRGVLVRPDGVGRTSVSLNVVASSPSQARELQAISSGSQTSVGDQKAYFQRLFADGGWRIPRFLREMHESDNWYLAEVAQARRNRWSTGRVVLVGDTAYCPSAITGKGTTLAITGAYVLASKLIAHHKRDSSGGKRGYAEALEAYERELRPWIEDVQSMASPTVIKLANPASRWGIALRHVITTTIGVLIWLGVGKVATKFLVGKDKTFDIGAPDEFGVLRETTTATAARPAGKETATAKAKAE